VSGQASILVAEDDAVSRATLVKGLEHEGHRVTTAEDGRRAWDLLQLERFDAVLLDILMPELDGFEVLSRMKADPGLRHLPVIVVTSVDDVASAVRCLEIGADDYVTKPFDPVLLRARLNAGLAKKRLRDLEKRHLEEVAELNARLEARVEEQMAELVRTGELRRFLPPQVAEGLLSGGLAPDGLERRRVTILFSDMVGFTDLSDSLDPEELAEVLDEYLREMTAVLISHGATLDNYIGDGLMAVFGAPTPMSDEEQAWSAVESALDMRDRAGADVADPRPGDPCRAPDPGRGERRPLHGRRVRKRRPPGVQDRRSPGQHRRSAPDGGGAGVGPDRLPDVRVGPGAGARGATGAPDRQGRGSPRGGLGAHRADGA
jgi:adenylate cyclase